MPKRRRRRRLRWGRLLSLMLGLLIVFASIVGAVTYAWVTLRLDSVKPLNIVIIGLDNKSGGKKRSDALMLASVNPQQHNVELLSIPRDSYVRITCEDNQKDKITHAYYFGQRACTMDSIQQLFELEQLQYYVAVDFEQMIALVDLIDGIELKPSKSFCQNGTDKKQYCFEKGQPITLDGQSALAYSRQRKIDSDVHRAERQQEILKAIMAKAKTLEWWKVYPLVEQILTLTDTNLDLVHLAAFYRMSKEEDFIITSKTIKGENALYYSPGTQVNQYMYEIDSQWLKEYRARLKELLAP